MLADLFDVKYQKKETKNRAASESLMSIDISFLFSQSHCRFANSQPLRYAWINPWSKASFFLEYQHAAEYN